MRTPEYLSPTSVKLFWSDRAEYYLRYLADTRADRFPQTLPMSAGSAFDARVKSFLYERLVGPTAGTEYEYRTLFEAQVEEHNRDWALPFADHAFQQYRQSGALADMVITLQKSVGPPRFEFSIQGELLGKDLATDPNSNLSVPLLGKPDVYLTTEQGERCVLDYKVNGACAKAAVSPAKGYVICRDGWDHNRGKASRSHGKSHPDAHLVNRGGIIVNSATTLEAVNEEWAAQLAVYSWLLGEDIGTEIVIGIDQLCGMGNEVPGGVQVTTKGYCDFRIAIHRCVVSKAYQDQLWKRIQEQWSIVQSGWIFRDMSEDESYARQASLDKYAENIKGEDELSAFMRDLRSGAKPW